MTTRPDRKCGFTLIELLVSLAIGSFVLLGLGYVVNQGLESWRVQKEQTDAQTTANFAVTRMAESITSAQQLLVPQNGTPRPVLGLVIGSQVDADGDGFADADKDQDGRTNEDPSADASNDGAAGIIGIDDDNDGFTDEGAAEDDDEDGASDEDKIDGIDNDSDGLVDEDPPADSNNDGSPGIAGLDDDGDTVADEGVSTDDDEDGLSDEDWWDTVVYYLNGSQLKERLPNPNPSSGTDYTERTIADNVSAFAVTALPRSAGDRGQVVEVKLVIQQPDGSVLTLTAQRRIGGGR